MLYKGFNENAFTIIRKKCESRKIATYLQVTKPRRTFDIKYFAFFILPYFPNLLYTKDRSNIHMK